MIVFELRERFYVKNGDGFVLAGPFKTNADAWRWIDRQESQPLSKAEDRADWVFSQIAGGKGL